VAPGLHAVSAVTRAILAVMDDLAKVGIAKDRTNQQQHFQYRGIDDLRNVLAPLLVKHKLLILSRVLERQMIERESKQGGALFSVVLKMEYDFLSAEDESSKTVGPFFGEAMDSGDKATNKALSIAYKYMCFDTFCIRTEGVDEAAHDPDATVHEVAAAPEPPPTTWDGSQRVGFSKRYRDAKWSEVPQDFLDWVTGTGNRLNGRQRECGELEQRRRNDVAAADLPKDLPDSFFEGFDKKPPASQTPP